jgi:hypothetical protein
VFCVPYSATKVGAVFETELANADSFGAPPINWSPETKNPIWNLLGEKFVIEYEQSLALAEAK